MPRKRPKSNRGPDRPRSPTLRFERIHWVQSVEDWAEEYKQAGSEKPYLEVLLDLLEMTGGHLTETDEEEIDKPEVAKAVDAKRAIVERIVADETLFEKIKKNFKKKRHKARRELQMMKELAERRNAYLCARRRQ